MIVERQFESCLLFYFPHVHAVIDWTVEPKFLDQELQKIIGDGEAQNRRVDKLVEVQLQDGSGVWLLIHIEIQNSKDGVFEERMFIYFYRIYDKYKRYPISLAILTDDDANWRPTQHHHTALHCAITLDFPTVKLLDYDLDALEKSTNPFALITKAHLETAASGKSDKRRYATKFRLMRMLFKSGYTRQEIQDLLLFINWILQLPPELEQQLRHDVAAVDPKEKEMYITNWDRIMFDQGIEEGKIQGRIEMILRQLKLKFGSVSSETETQLSRIEDIDKLDEIGDSLLTINSLDELALETLDDVEE